MHSKLFLPVMHWREGERQQLIYLPFLQVFFVFSLVSLSFFAGSFPSLCPLTVFYCWKYTKQKAHSVEADGKKQLAENGWKPSRAADLGVDSLQSFHITESHLIQLFSKLQCE